MDKNARVNILLASTPINKQAIDVKKLLLGLGGGAAALGTGLAGGYYLGGRRGQRIGRQQVIRYLQYLQARQAAEQGGYY